MTESSNLSSTCPLSLASTADLIFCFSSASEVLSRGASLGYAA